MSFAVMPYQLAQRQALPLHAKIAMSKQRIKEWYVYHDGNVYVSFSGGKDSTVLLHLVRSMYPNVKAMFIDTGLEYPELRAFVKSIDNVDWIKPNMDFLSVIKKYGYPVISKEVARNIYEIKHSKSDKLRDKRLYGDAKGNWKLSNKWRFLINAPFKISDKCCQVMKKSPASKYQTMTRLKPFVGTMAADSRLRETTYLMRGCNSFEGKQISTPLAFWLESDIWEYIKIFNVKYSKIYDMGFERTGCMFCMFGIHMEKQSRFERMKKTHPKLYDYCMNVIGCKDVIDYCLNKDKTWINLDDDANDGLFDEQLNPS